MAELWDVYDINFVKTGRLHERNVPLSKGDYHLVVHIWIVNSKGEFLITKRSPGIPWGGYWQATGGSALAGDESLTAALRETREEIGVALDAAGGVLFKHFREKWHGRQSSSFVDVWLFQKDIAADDIVLQPEETCDVMWASKDEILRMRLDGMFLPPYMNLYFEELAAYCEQRFRVTQ